MRAISYLMLCKKTIMIVHGTEGAPTLCEHSLLPVMVVNIHGTCVMHRILGSWYQVIHLNLIASPEVSSSFLPSSCTGIFFDLKMKKQKPDSSHLGGGVGGSCTKTPSNQAPRLISCHQVMQPLTIRSYLNFANCRKRGLLLSLVTFFFPPQFAL